MKKTLVAGFWILALGSFSFVDAANIYEQPSGTDIRTGIIQFVGSATGTQSTIFTATQSNRVDGGRMYFGASAPLNESFIACLWDMTSDSSLGCSDNQAGDGVIRFYDLTFDAGAPTYLTIGHRYKGVLLAVDVDADASTYYANTQAEMLFIISDREGLVILPNWGLMFVTSSVDTTAIVQSATSTGLFSSWSSSSTLAAISENCSEAGNIFSRGICWSFSYLFIPNPSVIDQFVGLGSTTASKFPFSYVFGVIGLFSSLTASTSVNMIAPHIDFASVDPAASTTFGTFLPDITFLSTSTIQSYMPSGFWAFIYSFMSIAMWITFVFMVIREARKILYSA